MNADRCFLVLVVDGNDVGQAKLTEDFLNYPYASFAITHKSSSQVGSCLYDRHWDAVVLDAPELRRDNLDLMREIKLTKPSLPLICVTDDEDIRKAEEAVEFGCEDVYIREAVDGVTVPRKVILAQAWRRGELNSKPHLAKLKEMLDDFNPIMPAD